jgi:hypothetical protein
MDALKINLISKNNNEIYIISEKSVSGGSYWGTRVPYLNISIILI